MSIDDYLNKNDKTYYVADAINCNLDKVDYLILVESPHYVEVEFKYPLAGRSGLSMSQHLINDDFEIPFGKLVNDRTEITNMAGKKLGIAIVNVSNNPLQVIEANKDDVRDIISDLNKIRAGDLINNILIESLKVKLCPFSKNKEMKILVCGVFAQTYFDKYLESITDENQECNIRERTKYLPHPSRNHWQFVKRHSENLRNLNEIFILKTVES
jgi:hypothetical protein